MKQNYLTHIGASLICHHTFIANNMRWVVIEMVCMDLFVCTHKANRQIWYYCAYEKLKTFSIRSIAGSFCVCKSYDLRMSV